MRILFDQGTPAPLRQALPQHEVETAYERGWSTLANGALLAAAEAAGFELFVTTDLNLQHQQNLAERTIAIVVLSTTSWPRIRAALEDVSRAIEQSATIRYVVEPTAHPKVLRSPADPVDTAPAAAHGGARETRGKRGSEAAPGLSFGCRKQRARRLAS